MQRNNENQNTNMPKPLSKAIEIGEQDKFVLSDDESYYYLNRSETNYDEAQFKCRFTYLNKISVKSLQKNVAFQDELLLEVPFVRNKDTVKLTVDKYNRYKDFLVKGNAHLIQDYDPYRHIKKSTKRYNSVSFPVAKIQKVNDSNSNVTEISIIDENVNKAKSLLIKSKGRFYLPENIKLPNEIKIHCIPFTLNDDVYESIDFCENKNNLNKKFDMYFGIKPFERNKADKKNFYISISDCKSIILNNKDNKILKKVFDETFIEQISKDSEQSLVPVQSNVANTIINKNNVTEPSNENNNVNNSNISSLNYAVHITGSNAMFPSNVIDQHTVTTDPISNTVDSAKGSISDNTSKSYQ